MTIKTWTEVKNEINKNSTKSVLLGNGFSMCWSYEHFKQSNLKSEIKILDGVTGENPEQCIKSLKDCITDNIQYKEIIQEIIDKKITADFIRVLFQRLPQRIDKEKAVPFVEFLSMFNNYFTLNYDSLLYFLLNKFKISNQNNDFDSNAVIHRTMERIEPIISNVIERDLYSKISDNQYEKMGAMSEQKMDFVRKQIINELNKHYDDIPEITNLFTRGGLKSTYKNLINNRIAAQQEGEIKPELKKLIVNDGFSSDAINLIWDKGSQCNLFHIHGAYHIFENDNEAKIYKMSSTNKDGMLENIENYLNNGNMPFVILDGTYENKLDKINKNLYLKHCYESLEKINDTLVSLGVSFADNDQHIIDAIVNNTNLNKIYIGLWQDEKLESEFKRLKEKFNKILDKVVFYTYNDTFAISKSGSLDE